MSLLMEALRKAEEAKRRMQQEEQAAGGKGEERDSDLTPEYIRDNFTSAENQPETFRQQPNQPAEEASLTADAEPEYTRRAATAAGAPALARRQQRAAAASVFTAKQNPARNRKMLTVLVLVMVLMIPAGGAVLWYLQSAPTSSLGISPAIANYDLSSRGLVGENPLPDLTEPASAANEGSTAAPTINAERPAAADQPVAAPPTAEAELDEPFDANDAAPAPEAPRQTELATTATPATPAVTPAALAETPTISANTQPATVTTSVLEISRSRSGSQINPDLVAAYESLQAGDFATARRLYQQLLGVLPNNRDAMLGLASISLREGDVIGARGHYARLLQLNPRDPLAHTGLLQTMEAKDSAELERTLKSLISRYPDVAQLTLALGNFYASQQRWSEAQSAYYNALLTASRGTAGPVHPDYAFNLAVSLEQLNEPEAALNFYRRAKTLAAEVTPGFDPQLLNSRLAFLLEQQTKP